MSDKTIDMCNGPLFKKVFVFALPMMLSGVLQLLFNAVDMRSFKLDHGGRTRTAAQTFQRQCAGTGKEIKDMNL